MFKNWLPKSVIVFKSYSKQLFLSDLIAGITVGLVALPLAMAFAIASGLPPQTGLYCGIIAGFLISAFGGSLTQIGGPTGAFVVVVSDIVSKYGFDSLLLCTALAGVCLIILGASGLGSAVKFIPRPVVIGFTNGIAVIIASTQLKNFFGLQIEQLPSNFLGRMKSIIYHLPTLSWVETILSISALLVILLFARYVKRIPGYIVVLVCGTGLVWFFKIPVETIGFRFGKLPSGLPAFAFPHFRFELIHQLLSPIMTITMLGAIESLMSAVVADKMSGDKHNPNVELIAQGIANIASPLFGGLPATGAIARTATNIRSGAQTPVAGMIHALTLLVILLFAAPLAQFIPLSILAAILLVVSYNMGEWHEIPQLLKLSNLEIGTWLVTFLLTVFADLTVAVQAGMILAALIFIRKVTYTTTITRITPEYVQQERTHALYGKKIPSYVAMFRIHGPFLFGAADKLDEIIQQLPELPPILILRLLNMTSIDATGIKALEQFADIVQRAGKQLILCGASGQPAKLMQKAKFEKHVSQHNICQNIVEALDRAHVLFSSHKS